MDAKDAIEIVNGPLEQAVIIVLPFFVCLAAIQVLVRNATRWRLVDMPTERKRHDGPVPVVGGIAMFVGLAVATVLLALRADMIYLLGAGVILVILGFLDDRHDLPFWFRLIVQSAVTLTLIELAEVRIFQIGDLIGDGPVILSPAIGSIFTVVCTLGVINAVNMIDGVDGLAGSVLLISFFALAWVALGFDQFHSAKILFACSGVLLAFLTVNARVFVPRALAFMGDSGSMLFGLIFVWYLVKLSQPPVDALSAVAAGWIFGVPLMDTVSVIARRLRERRSPFSAGRDHLHHRLLDAGYGVNVTVLIIMLLQGAFALFGLWLNAHREYEMAGFWAFVVITVTYFGLVRRLPVAPGATNGR